MGGSTGTGRGRMPVRLVEIGHQAFAAMVGRKTVGTASAWMDSRDVFCILKSYVRPDYRRRGIATMLYNAIEAKAGKELRPAVSLSDEAFEFWKGFRPSAVAEDLRHRKAELLGRQVMERGRLGTIISASGGVATAEYRMGCGGVQTFCVLRRDLDEALRKADEVSRGTVGAPVRTHVQGL